MRNAALLIATTLAAGCPPAGPPPTTPAPEPDPGAADPAAGPLNADEAAARLLPVETDPGQAALVVHCSFLDGWVAAVPEAVAAQADEFLLQDLVRLGADPGTADATEETARLRPHAARSCSPDAVLILPSGDYELLVGRRDRLAGSLARDAGWIEYVHLTAGDRLEYHLSADDVTLEVPCR